PRPNDMPISESQLLDNQPVLLDSMLSRVSKPSKTMLTPKMSSLRSRVRPFQNMLKEDFEDSWRDLADLRVVFFAVERFLGVLFEVLEPFLAGISMC
ncbi:MAG: hypothetical protein JSW42_09435, partial [Chloroflexota bacterium]